MHSPIFRGFIDCRWEAKVMNTRKRQEKENYQFHLDYKSELLPPGRSSIINVYFQPRKTVPVACVAPHVCIDCTMIVNRLQCYTAAKLKVIVEMGLEDQTVTLHGHGTSRKLQISDLNIVFLPVVPFAGAREKIFTIENVCEDPVEFFWHHLDR